MEFLSSIVNLWVKQINLAEKSKHEAFGKTAKRCWDFLGQDWDKLYIHADGKGQLPASQHRIRRNLTAEYRALMLPYLHHKVPHRMVTPDRMEVPPELLGIPPGMVMPPDPTAMQDKLRSMQLQTFLNYIPKIYGLREEARRSVSEALVKGRGVMVHEMFEGPTGAIPGSFYKSVDDLLIDPDATTLREAGWIDLKYHWSVWRVAEMFGIKAAEIKAKYTSHLQQAARNEIVQEVRPDESNDIVEVHFIFSRMGMGQKFSAAGEDIKGIAQALNDMGDHVFLAVVEGMDYPLNLPPGVADNPDAQTALDDIRQRLAWPIPFHEIYRNPWPISVLDFYPSLDTAWADSPLQGALPLQVFLDHAYGYVMGRLRSTARDLILTSSALEKKLNDAICGGLDQTVVVTEQVAQDMAKLLHVIQFPPMQTDLWNVIQMVERAFEKASGMDSLLYGGQGGTQIRSSAEVQIRNENLMNRPEDMAECAERWQSQIAAMEGFMARVAVAPATVAPLFREQYIETPMGMNTGPLTNQWSMLVNTADPRKAAAEVEYTVESGSGRRKNKQKQQADAQLMMQTMFQPTLNLAMQGVPDQFNALIDYMADTYDNTVLNKMKFPPPNPQAMQQQGMPQPQPAGV